MVNEVHPTGPLSMSFSRSGMETRPTTVKNSDQHWTLHEGVYRIEIPCIFLTAAAQA